jgi:hypothetical protein
VCKIPGEGEEFTISAFFNDANKDYLPYLTKRLLLPYKESPVDRESSATTNLVASISGNR